MRGRCVFCGHHSLSCFSHLWHVITQDYVAPRGVGGTPRIPSLQKLVEIDNFLLLRVDLDLVRHTHVDHTHHDHRQAHVQEDSATVYCRGTIHCCIMHRRLRCSRYVRCLHRLFTRSGHHRDQPKLLSSKHSGINAVNVFVHSDQVVRVHVRRDHACVDHIQPEEGLSQALLRSRESRIHVFRPTPDLIVVPLTDVEPEWISCLPVNVICSNCIPFKQLIPC